MYFITAFDADWRENMRRFFDIGVVPKKADGSVQYLDQESRHCFGYFADKERAVQAVLDNELGLHEEVYTLCVVEYIPEGLSYFSGTESATWFEWEPLPFSAWGDSVNGVAGGVAEQSGQSGQSAKEADREVGGRVGKPIEHGHWVACEPPPETRQIVGFALE